MLNIHQLFSTLWVWVDKVRHTTESAIVQGKRIEHTDKSETNFNQHVVLFPFLQTQITNSVLNKVAATVKKSRPWKLDADELYSKQSNRLFKSKNIPELQ